MNQQIGWSAFRMCGTNPLHGAVAFFFLIGTLVTNISVIWIKSANFFHEFSFEDIIYKMSTILLKTQFAGWALPVFPVETIL